MGNKHKIKIELIDPDRPMFYNVYIDDKEVGSQVRGFDIHMELGKVPEITLHFRAGVNLEAIGNVIATLLSEEKTN